MVNTEFIRELSREALEKALINAIEYLASKKLYLDFISYLGENTKIHINKKDKKYIQDDENICNWRYSWKI